MTTLQKKGEQEQNHKAVLAQLHQELPARIERIRIAWENRNIEEANPELQVPERQVQVDGTGETFMTLRSGRKIMMMAPEKVCYNKVIAEMNRKFPAIFKRFKRMRAERNRLLAFLMGSHSKLGSTSTVQMLDHDILRNIATRI